MTTERVLDGVQSVLFARVFRFRENTVVDSRLPQVSGFEGPTRLLRQYLRSDEW
jgi:hypothetical protein